MSRKYQGGGFGDWYLPSKYALNLFCAQKAAVGGLDINFHWSSSDGARNRAWLQGFGNGDQLAISKSDASGVRAIRSF